MAGHSVKEEKTELLARLLQEDKSTGKQDWKAWAALLEPWQGHMGHLICRECY